jgi:hypothetical protein
MSPSLTRDKSESPPLDILPARGMSSPGPNIHDQIGFANELEHLGQSLPPHLHKSHDFAVGSKN